MDIVALGPWLPVGFDGRCLATLPKADARRELTKSLVGASSLLDLDAISCRRGVTAYITLDTAQMARGADLYRCSEALECDQ